MIKDLYQKMRQIYMLRKPYHLHEKKHLAHKYLETVPKSEEFLGLLKKVYRELDKFSVVMKNGTEEIENLEWDSKEQTLVYKIYQRDLVTGVNKPQVIVKKLKRFAHTYELRINTKYYKYRVLFQFNNLHQHNEYFIILSYGFTKIEDQQDLTDSLSDSNDKIKQTIISDGRGATSFYTWLEEEVT